jgi:SAM-dependent methyltransferase
VRYIIMRTALMRNIHGVYSDSYKMYSLGCILKNHRSRRNFFDTIYNMVLFLFFTLEFLLLGFVLLMLHLAWRPIVLGEPPFYPTPARSLNFIIQELGLTRGSILYDMGCGDGRILFECLRRHPDIKAVGVEHDFVPFLLAWLEKRRSPQKNSIRFIRGNIFKEPCSDATHVYLFTFPEFIDKLLPHLEKELKPGTRVVLLDFPFLHKLPKKIVDIPGPGAVGQRVYVYEF